MSQLTSLSLPEITEYVILPKFEPVPWTFKDIVKNVVPNSPSDWFAYHFQTEAETYGPPILEKRLIFNDETARIIPLSLNEDFFAAILGTEKCNLTVYLDQEQRWYRKPKDSSFFVAATDQDLKFCLSQWFIKSVQGMSPSVDITQIFNTFRSNEVLDRILERAKAILKVDEEYFSQDGPNLRNPIKVPSESIRAFVEQCMVQDDPAVLTVKDCFQAYETFCLGKSLPKVHLNQFKVAIAPHIRKKFDKGVRNDLDRYGGDRCLGWRGIGLRGVDTPPAEAGQVAGANL